jgi:hypothetical protein
MCSTEACVEWSPQLPVYIGGMAVIQRRDLANWKIESVARSRRLEDDDPAEEFRVR